MFIPNIFVVTYCVNETRALTLLLSYNVIFLAIINQVNPVAPVIVRQPTPG